MAGSKPRAGSTLTLQLCGVLVMGAVALSFLVTMAAAEGTREERTAELHRRQLEMCTLLARRAAPLLERGDDLRLSVLATSAADLVDGRVVMIDGAGRVRLDTGLTLGGQTVLLESSDGPLQRPTRDDRSAWEVLAPALGNEGGAGEVRIRYRVDPTRGAAFPWSLFGLVLLCSVSLVTLACWIAHAWVQRIRTLARHAQQIARGETTTAAQQVIGGGAVAELENAVLELTVASTDAAQRARSGFLELAREVVHALELRGHVPAGSPEHTRRHALAIAEQLGADEATRRDLAEAALLMDLGKAGVRPSALTKGGLLDDVERDSLRQHPVRGASLINALPSLDRVAAAIRHQHEKWDGTGFPDGLRGERIPLTSRILAVASAYEMMTSCSVHGRPVSWPDALDRLREDRGVHFDPAVVDAFEQLIRQSPPRTDETRIAISTEGVLPYRAVHGELGRGDVPVFEDEAVDEILAYSDSELEVVFDDLPEDRA